MIQVCLVEDRVHLFGGAKSMRLLFSMLLLAALLLIPYSVRAASLELQGLCAAQAREAFKSGGWDAQPLAAFVNHYDDASNKCFVAIRNTQTFGATTWIS